MTDKHLTSQPSADASSQLCDTLSALRNHGVASAKFGDNGQLLQVEFYAPALAGDDAPAEQIIKTAVDGALASLATRGQPRERDSQ